MKKAHLMLKRILTLLALILTLSGFNLSVSAAEPFELHLLDVGQGQSVLIKADGHYMLIDGGGRDASSFVVSYLRQQGVDNLDCMVLSHYDEDHMAGLIGALSVFHTDVFLAPAYAGEGDLYQSLAVAALSNGCVVMHPVAGWQFQVGNANIEIVGPVGEYTSGNDCSLSVRISYGDTAYLICGDAEQQSEIDMVGSGTNLKADVYVVNHHGSSTSSMDAFLDAVSPTYALISCGADNGYGHPSMETLQRFQNHGTAMFRTDKQGTIVAYSDGSDIWFNTDPCDDWTAGNGVISLEGTGAEAGGEVTRGMPEEEETFQYVCNTNTKKFHYPDCNSVKQMKEENRLYTDLSREDLIAQGYEPCGNCNP
ncbi:MAG: MBL fold metallo-hydrolase [Blautia sp.]|nr:MBL fold metallo-hydrolase [Blautia sp.]